MNIELINDMYEAPVRAEEIIHLPTMAWTDDSPAECLADAFESDPEPLLDAIGIDGEAIYEMFELSEALRDEQKTGWLVKFSTPVPTNFTESGYAFSWGYYTSKWFYGEDYEQLCRDALAWQEAFVQRRKAKEQAA